MLASAVLSLCRPRFQAGKLRLSPQVLTLIQDRQLNIMSYLSRHLVGDWGDISPVVNCTNDAALRGDDDKLHSSYTLSPDVRLLIVTDLNRQMTDALLSSEPLR